MFQHLFDPTWIMITDTNSPGRERDAHYQSFKELASRHNPSPPRYFPQIRPPLVVAVCKTIFVFRVPMEFGMFHLS
jgi:hypothetical protein